MKQATVLPEQAKAESEQLSSEFDVLALLDKSGEILKREITNLMIESATKKLSAASAKDLVAYVKLLHELKLEQLAKLQAMSDEELKGLIPNEPID